MDGWIGGKQRLSGVYQDEAPEVGKIRKKKTNGMHLRQTPE